MRGLYFQFRVRLLHGGKAMSWLENFSKAIEYIETHLDKEISYEDMAKITGCSTSIFKEFFLILSVFHYLNISDDAE